MKSITFQSFLNFKNSSFKPNTTIKIPDNKDLPLGNKEGEH